MMGDRKTTRKEAVMARVLTFVPSTAAPAATRTLALDAIPDEIKAEVEEIYTALKANPSGRMRAKFETKAELLQYITLVTSYCTQRPTGPIRFRKSPTRNLPDNEMDFRITDPMVESDAATEAIQNATAKVNSPTPIQGVPVPAPKKAAKAGGKR